MHHAAQLSLTAALPMCSYRLHRNLSDLMIERCTRAVLLSLACCACVCACVWERVLFISSSTQTDSSSCLGGFAERPKVWCHTPHFTESHRVKTIVWLCFCEHVGHRSVITGFCLGWGAVEASLISSNVDEKWVFPFSFVFILLLLTFILLELSKVVFVLLIPFYFKSYKQMI